MDPKIFCVISSRSQWLGLAWCFVCPDEPTGIATAMQANHDLVEGLPFYFRYDNLGKG
jgi:hypothetical protein